MVYICSVHKQAKLDRHLMWSRAEYDGVIKLKGSQDAIESVCDQCINAARISLRRLFVKKGIDPVAV